LLRWHRYNAPYYCVFSGLPGDSALTQFEGAVTDTFMMVPYGASSIRCFQVRLCDGVAPR